MWAVITENMLQIRLGWETDAPMEFGRKLNPTKHNSKCD